MLPLLLALASEPTAAAMLRNAADMLAIPRCAPSAQTDEVTVCGRRRADRYRAPLIVRDPGDPRHEGVRAERTRLLHRTTPLQDLSPFLVGGGMAGVTVTTGGRGTRVAGLRELAP